MTLLSDYRAFSGRHYETGSVHNILAYQDVQVPHTAQPFSEALLLGISGGITFGYFTFEYKGHLPHLALLTRNTFDPLETLFNRLVIPRDVRRTTSSEKGLKNLINVLEAGQPALVWADVFSMPYRLLPSESQMWGMHPVVVYGIENDDVLIADCSNQPFCVPVKDFQAARGRVKKDKYKLLTLDAPNMDLLPRAVEEGIRQCLALYLDAPPKGRKENFGLAALEYWAKMLINTRNKRSWDRVFPAGPKLYSALAGSAGQPGAFDWLMTWGTADGADRGVYADFLEEAATILGKDELNNVASQFRELLPLWNNLARALLPDKTPLLKQARALKLKKQQLYIEKGMNALNEIKEINETLAQLEQQVEQDFPIAETRIATFRENLSESILEILVAEKEAVMNLKEVMG